MNRVALALIVLITGFARITQAAPERNLTLLNSSTYEDGCFAPCMCPVLIHDDLRGGFSLIPIGTENGYDVFAVKDLEWVVRLWDRSTLFIRGSGTYRSSTELKLQRMEVDLLVGDRPREHYDSGLVPIRVPVPDFSITISKHGQYCYDTVFTIDAAPSSASSNLRPPGLQFEHGDVPRGATTTWGRLKKLWPS
jgi:hypothetical protein